MTRRSRSSFDLRDVLPVAEALSPKPAPSASTSELQDFGGVPLVAFGADRPSQPPAASARSSAPSAPRAELEVAPVIEGGASLMARLSRLLEWLRGDRDVTRALVVDDEGLPLVGSTSGDLGDAESLLAATGSVASAMKRLALATPGSLSGDFEGHVGDGPVLQLVGIPVGGRAFIVGISRRQPFGKLDVERIREAFEKALASSALTSSSTGGA
jgi:predicted regulator of Ras-like GTPase activity (Roadblock/LC7/MglB family)